MFHHILLLYFYVHEKDSNVIVVGSDVKEVRQIQFSIYAMIIESI